jgi:Protein of unknown function (DUF2934)
MRKPEDVPGLIGTPHRERTRKVRFGTDSAVTPYVVKFTLTFAIFEQEITRMTDSFEQYRHELMRKLAYEYWERRGRPFGSSEVDWSAAEKAIDPYLLTSGQEFPPLEIRPEPDEGPFGSAF